MAITDASMAAKKRILAVCVKLFLEKGYNRTTVAEITKGAGVSISTFQNIFRAKDGVLNELVEFMFSNQFGVARRLAGADAPPVYVYAVETVLQLVLTERNENLRDIYLEAYTQSEAAEYIHKRTASELRNIFGTYLPGYSESDFYEMELGSAGIMRGYMARKCDMYFTIEKKITLFLQCALKIYDVPAQERETVIPQVLAMDLAAMARSTVENTVRLAQAGFDMETLRASAADERKEDML